MSINKRIFLQQFLIWWGIFFLFVMGVFYFPHRLSSGDHGPMLHDTILCIECTALGAFMAIGHYYLIYKRFSGFIYVALTIALIGLFILLDNVLFFFQIGREDYFSDKFTHLLFVNFERVMIAYIPVVLVYTLVRNSQIRRKARKNS